MKRKTLPLEDALYYIYSSNLYKALLDENTKLWYSSPLSLYRADKVILSTADPNQVISIRSIFPVLRIQVSNAHTEDVYKRQPMGHERILPGDEQHEPERAASSKSAERRHLQHYYPIADLKQT